MSTNRSSDIVRRNLPAKPAPLPKPSSLHIKVARKSLRKTGRLLENHNIVPNAIKSPPPVSSCHSEKDLTVSNIKLTPCSSPKQEVVQNHSDLESVFESLPELRITDTESPYEDDDSEKSVPSVLSSIGASVTPDNMSLSDFNETDLKNSLSFNTSVDENSTFETEGTPEPPTRGKDQKKAFRVAEELLTSEKVYIEALQLIVHDFVEFVSKDNVIPLKELDKIITPLPHLLTLNDHLLSNFQQRINNWENEPKIADVFAKMGQFLKLYSTYVQNLEAQYKHLDECCLQYPEFAKALYQFESSEKCKKLTLRHYMLKPVQRLPQYRLLLNEYLGNLDESSPDYTDTSKALSTIEDVLNHINSSMKTGENIGKLLQLQASLGGSYEVIKPGREYIKEGELYKHCRKDRQLRYFILLSDCLIYASYTTSVTGMKFKMELPLRGMKVSPEPFEPSQFKITTVRRSFTLEAKNQGEREVWMSALRSAIGDANSKQKTFSSHFLGSENTEGESLNLGREAPVWIQDKKATMCQVCTADFSTFFRRHHCRSCGKVVCGLCSNCKAPLEYFKFESVRVCDNCYEYLLKEYESPSENVFQRIKDLFDLSDFEAPKRYEEIRLKFKKYDGKKIMKSVPQSLKEVPASDTGSQMSGWLDVRGRRGGWKRYWVVLKHHSLYMYKASHDVAAHVKVPIFDYSIDRDTTADLRDVDVGNVFRLTHSGVDPVILCAPDRQTADLWVSELETAVRLV